MKMSPTSRETRACAARLALREASRSQRLSGRCGSAALDYGDVRVAGQLVAVPLCQEHFRILRDSLDPIALALTWAPEAPLL
jgi:hypothetical protein